MSKEKTWKKWVAFAVCAAVIAGAVIGMSAKKKSEQGGSKVVTEMPGTATETPVVTTTEYPGVSAVEAAYPEATAQKLSAQQFMESDAHWEWWDEYRNLAEISEGLQAGIDAYNRALMAQLLLSENENTVCSPLNTYIAFAMLAEVSDGNTRQQILDMLGTADIETLRNNVSSLWKSNYADTPVLKSIPANSLWLNGGVEYNGETLGRLAGQYFASAFSGTPGSAEMDEALRAWTDENTGGLLAEYTKDMSISADTVLEILSTIYYKAMWVDNFQEAGTTRETFHGVSGDTSVDMMHRTDMTGVYRADKFTSIGLGLSDSGAMYFLLPNEGVDVNALVSDPDVINAIRNGGEEDSWSYPEVHMSVPKFKVSGKVDLIEAVRALGVTDALDYTVADFTPLTTDRDELFLSKAEHAAMIEIDENGVTGAAYTELALTEGAALPSEEIEFVLDRPFMFVVTGCDGSVLFAGIVRNIE